MAVLVSQVEVDVLAGLETQTQGEAVGGLPVGVVGRGGVARTGRLERTVAEAVFVEDGRNPVVACAQSQCRQWLELGTQLEGMHTLERALGMGVHHVVAAAGVIGVAVPWVVVCAVYHAVVYAAIVRILIGGAQGEVAAHGVAQTHAKLPRSIYLVLVVAVVPDVSAAVVIRQVSAVLYKAAAGVAPQFQVIEDRAVDVQTHAERRAVNGQEDGTHLDIDASTVYLQPFGRGTVGVLLQLLKVGAAGAIVHIV